VYKDANNLLETLEYVLGQTAAVAVISVEDSTKITQGGHNFIHRNECNICAMP